MQKPFELNSDPHTRLNILTGERVLVSPHRSKRPWQGQVEDVNQEQRPEYDAQCYLCPTNKRADGDVNPDYTESFVFVNDFSALLKDTPHADINEDELFIAESEKGICKVIAFSPRHDLTLPEMSVPAIKAVVDVWQDEFAALTKNEWIKYIQIFENKGAIMGCSNPHPHGQIWSQNHVPMELQKESVNQKKYFDKYGKTMLSAYIDAELKKSERIIEENDSFVALVPFWASWPYETMLISKRSVQNILAFTEKEKEDLAAILKLLTTRYDNLFNTSFPYSAGMHQSPVNSGDFPEWHWHMHFYPPLLRSATVKKFMVGYEMLANPQRDITPEFAAQQLRNCSTIHYKTV
ncbi:UDP-glucose--hexose-1-phosphate uridylyltransferase [Sphingobacterium sp. SRCM116780]|uniref:UDP-glucose--hexose-1-phosphate uridylyltransferase n=1 Tax=Sphingobacterium sp. SRCM116780 TaxID=2907623 RepID=UPI001F4395D7|nr:UDP-glucose--hexose-1-phosphate uridylyltransferase [Sphingobacterium sp. SRCM116780]UIR55560.1 UDP-glucose--hexose-1-phosphate uridylyltransferase [Sphingobacterium sp. SRCM116780]